MKKSLIISIFLIFLIVSLIIPLISAQENIPGVPGQIAPYLGKEPTQVAKQASQDATAWLKKAWEEQLAKSEFIIFFDNLFQNLSGIFYILFAMSYSHSIALWVVIFLWIYVGFEITATIKELKDFDIIKSLAIGIVCSIVLAWSTALLLIANLLIFIVSFFDAGWWYLASICIIFAALYLIDYFRREWLKKRIEEDKKEKEKVIEGELEEIEQGVGGMTPEIIKAVEEGFDSGSGVPLKDTYKKISRKQQ